MVGLTDRIQRILSTHKPEETFYVYDLGQVKQAYKEWTRVFPTIRPFYAVKCNPNRRVLQTLAELGSSFDCASKKEIKTVLGLGVDPDSIIYANPCKHPLDLAWAAANGITLTTFDSPCELYKIAKYNMRVILRIRADDPDAQCPLGNKYGAELDAIEDLCRLSADLGLDLVGVSFHVGSGSKNPEAHARAIEKAFHTFNVAKAYGHSPYILDIGGGFTDIHLVSERIYKKLSELFPFADVIAEPGRYIAERVGTLVTPVIGVKGDSVTIDESLYGSFNCILFDHAHPEPLIPDEKIKKNKILFGSTCDGMDTIATDILLPDLEVGDWLIWPHMGAYTTAATTCFNGIPFNRRKVFYFRGPER
jgi:ornithine decarboxylase